MAAPMPICDLCGKKVDPRRKGTYSKVIGWVERRGKVGGAHSIVEKKELGEFRHDACMADLKYRQQHTLF